MAIASTGHKPFFFNFFARVYLSQMDNRHRGARSQMLSHKPSLCGAPSVKSPLSRACM